ncbi:hypothetical protein CVIRNUC_007706 [Coccomyxa viridis]|uniref:HhH-GPD domain-containing protein n=1 Tax=Coccomyxa viridis TaxID=1274662 RepID=A0AAV1IBL4_9CHLO|nr:hypothetical protein CVIRNUC_007706 [Coccomyxa viridis]
MKGDNTHPRTRSLRNSNRKLSPEASVMHVKKEEDVSTGSPGPVSRSPKQAVKHEAKPDAGTKPRKKQRVKQEDPVAQQMVKLAAVSPTAYTGPFPKHMQPTPEACRAARDGLARLHGEPQHAKKVKPEPDAGGDNLHTHGQEQVLDSLVRTILSQNTTDITSHRAFASLKEAFPTWEEVLGAPSGKVEDSIRMGGLAEIKTERVKAILATLKQERGSISLEYIREMEDEELKAELTRFKGVGAKTVACVMMFCLARDEFPVDTHVWRISKKLGWVPGKANRDDTYRHMNIRVPADIRYDLHVLLVEHGKRCARCASNGKPRKESHGDCPLVNLEAGPTVKEMKEGDIVKDEDVIKKEENVIKKEDTG